MDNPKKDGVRGSATKEAAVRMKRATMITKEQIVSLADAANIETVATILGAFWTSCDTLYEELDRLLMEENLTEAAKTAHAIKGAASNLGAIIMAETASCLECACKDGDVVAARAAATKLSQDLPHTRAEFDHEVSLLHCQHHDLL